MSMNVSLSEAKSLPPLAGPYSSPLPCQKFTIRIYSIMITPLNLTVPLLIASEAIESQRQESNDGVV